MGGRIAGAITVLALSLPLTAASAPVAGGFRIVSGQSIGSIRLGEDDQAVVAQLHTAGAGDAAMGHAWSTWFSRDRRNDVDVYSTLAADAKGRAVRIIRVTSPAFKTRSGLGTGRSFADVRRAFPSIKRISAYVPAPGIARTYLYDDAQHGIAFEFRPGPEGRCVAISVHRPGQNPDSDYLTMTVYLREVAMGQAARP